MQRAVLLLTLFALVRASSSRDDVIRVQVEIQRRGHCMVGAAWAMSCGGQNASRRCRVTIPSGGTWLENVRRIGQRCGVKGIAITLVAASGPQAGAPLRPVSVKLKSSNAKSTTHTSDQPPIPLEDGMKLLLVEDVLQRCYCRRATPTIQS